MRICIISKEYPPHKGGMGRSVQRIARQLVSRDQEVTVFAWAMAGRPVSTQPVEDEGVILYSLPRGVHETRLFISAHHRAKPFDLFHCFPLWTTALGLDVSAGRQPVIAAIRGVDGLYLTQWSGAVSVLRDCTWITSVSRASLGRAGAFVEVAGRSSFIPNGIAADSTVSWQLTPQNRGVVGTVATIRPKKNLPLLVECYHRLPANFRKQLLLVGDAPDSQLANQGARQTVKKKIAALSLSPEVCMPGYVPPEQVGRYLAAMNVFVLPSDHEGMPNTILEAATAGLPIVATRVDGVLDILTQDHDALLVPPGNPEAMTAAITRVLTDPELAQRLAANARLTGAGLTVEAEAAAYEALYQQLLTQPVSPFPTPISRPLGAVIQ